jgi:hypothetical protein
LQKAHPEKPADAWRYAVWDSVNALLVARNGDAAQAGEILAAAQTVILQRFGSDGFYNLLAKRRALFIATSQKSETAMKKPGD